MIDGIQSFKTYVHLENVFGVLQDAHTSTGHGGRDRMLNLCQEKYENVTSEMICTFLELCEVCVLKKYSQKRGIVTTPILVNEFNSHVQADLVDMQAQECQEFRFFLVYQDHCTKFCQIRSLKRKTAQETASNILDMFLTFGPPKKLQTDNGREFKNHLLQEVCKSFGVHMVHGHPRHSQCNGGVERANQDIEKMLVTWKSDNPEKTWMEGLKFVQMYKNGSLCAPIKMSPFEATFGRKMSMGLKDSIVPAELFHETYSEDDFRKIGIITENEFVSSFFYYTV